MREARDASSRVPWPPIVFGSAFLLAFLLGQIRPLSFLPAGSGAVLRWLGWSVLALALALALWAEWAFWRAGTATLPTSPTSMLVETGPFAYSRNPIYLAMALGLAAFALAFDQVWFLIAAPVAVLSVRRLAIDREEEYLDRKFGAAYRAYRERVRRWL